MSGHSIRELGRRAGVSAAQLSRIEAGQVVKPSIGTLIEISRALRRNPELLLILSRHISHERAVAILRPMFGLDMFGNPESGIDSEVISWSEREEFLSELVDDATQLLATATPDEGPVRELAGELFITGHLFKETTWDHDSVIAQIAAERLTDAGAEHLHLFLSLSEKRQAKVKEYVLEQVQLDRLDADEAATTFEES
jgi:transcriptional regulator with XRE-family HTH domain